METQREKGEGSADRLGSLPHGDSLPRTVMTGRTIGKGLKEVVYVAQGGVLAYHVAAPGFGPPYQKGEKKERKPKTDEVGCWEDGDASALQSQGWRLRTGHKYSSSPGPSAKCLSRCSVVPPRFPHSDSGSVPTPREGCQTSVP